MSAVSSSPSSSEHQSVSPRRAEDFPILQIGWKTGALCSIPVLGIYFEMRARDFLMTQAHLIIKNSLDYFNNDENKLLKEKYTGKILSADAFLQRANARKPLELRKNEAIKKLNEINRTISQLHFDSRRCRDSFSFIILALNRELIAASYIAVALAIVFLVSSFLPYRFLNNLNEKNNAEIETSCKAIEKAVDGIVPLDYQSIPGFA